MDSTGVDGLRRANLARVLELVHRDGPLSRSQLTSRTGLNRSTIGALVSDLAERGLVAEQLAGSGGRVGRPSPVVAGRPDVAVLAVNPEVDAVSIAVIGLDRTILDMRRIETSRIVSPEAVAELIRSTLLELRSATVHATQLRVAGVGIAVPGLVDRAAGTVVRAPHLAWHHVPLRELVQTATGLPVAVGNDATLALRAEHAYGAARGLDNVVYLNGGAGGIGGGIVAHGTVIEGARGAAGEFGHNRPGIIDERDRRAGRDGVLEDEVSRTRLLAALGRRRADDLELAVALRSRTRTVDEEVERQRRVLATALADTVNALDPAILVLGGFLALLIGDEPAEFGARVGAQTIVGVPVEIRAASLGESRVLVGAADLAFAPLLDDPSSMRVARSAN